MKEEKNNSQNGSYKLRTRKIEKYDLMEDQTILKKETSNLDFKYDHSQPSKLHELEMSGANSFK